MEITRKSLNKEEGMKMSTSWIPLYEILHGDADGAEAEHGVKAESL